MKRTTGLLLCSLLTLAGCSAPQPPPPACPEAARTPAPACSNNGCEWIALPVRIQFDEGDDALTTEGEQLIAVVVESVADRDDLRVIAIDGHASDGEQGAESLSRRRALAVFESIREGLGPSLPIALRWFGSERPLTVENTAVDPRPYSRRVEFRALVDRR